MFLPNLTPSRSLRFAAFPTSQNETELIGDYFNTITTWLSAKKFQLPKVNLYEMDEVAQTHELIQSGKSIGKIVVRTNKNEL